MLKMTIKTKETDFNNITESQIKIVQEKLNNRPRKVLQFKTPHEVMALEHSYFFSFIKPQKK
jgi:IS30 family transposase